MCARQMPQEDAPVLELSARAWALAVRLLTEQAAAAADPADVRRLFDGLTRWRAHRTKWRASTPQRAAAQFLVEAAARLHLLDLCHSRGGADAVDARDVCETLLADAEQQALASTFMPAASAEAAVAAVAAVTARWRQPGSRDRECAHLAVAAHALLVTTAAGASSACPTRVGLLELSERCSTLCATREVLRGVVRDAVEEEPGEEEERVAAWLTRRALGPQSELTQRAHVDALAADMLDPALLPRADAQGGASAVATATPVSVLLTTQEPAVATAVVAACRTGARMLGDAATPARDAAVLAFSVFDHAVAQYHSTAWAAAYTASDARPEAALRRVRAYAVDNMVDPPPLLLLLDHRVYAIRRREGGGPGLGPVTVHESGAGALAAWVRSAREHPSVGPRMATVLRDAVAEHAEGGAEGLHELPVLAVAA